MTTKGNAVQTKPGYGNFGLFADEYHENRSGYPEAVFISAMREFVRIPKKSDSEIRILDIGCGTGLSTIGIMRVAQAMLPKHSITTFGLDKDEYMLSTARAYLEGELLSNNQCIFKKGTVMNDIVGRHFDIIVCASAFHWVAQEKGAVRKIRSLLKASDQEESKYPLLVLNRSLSDTTLQSELRSAAEQLAGKKIPDVKKGYHPDTLLQANRFAHVGHSQMTYTEVMPIENAIRRIKTASFWQEVPPDSREEIDIYIARILEKRISNNKLQLEYHIDTTVGYRS